MPAIRIGALGLSYTERGSGPPVVAVHSSGMSSRQWRKLAETLASTHRVILPDLLGYGDSTPYPDEERFHFSLDQVALERLLDAIGEPVHLVGHSYGGFLALLVALHRPRNVRSLAVYEPVSFGVLRSKNDAEALATLMHEDAPFPETPEATEDWLEGFIDYWNGPGGWRGLQEAARQAFRDTARKMIGEVRSLGAERTAHQAYATLEMPVLLLGSERSTLAAGRVLETLAATIPDARYERIVGAGHMGPLTHAAAVNAHIAEHMRRNP